MPTVKEVITEITNPRRRNNLEARRLKLGLSRVALGRILDVDPATVFRRERGPWVALWDYAMRGIEAEAKEAKPTLRSHKGHLDLQTIIPDHFGAQGFAYTTEKMNQARRVASSFVGIRRHPHAHRYTITVHHLAPRVHQCIGRRGYHRHLNAKGYIARSAVHKVIRNILAASRRAIRVPVRR